jgi:hypothetical protein
MPQAQKWLISPLNAVCRLLPTASLLITSSRIISVISILTLSYHFFVGLLNGTLPTVESSLKM